MRPQHRRRHRPGSPRPDAPRRARWPRRRRCPSASAWAWARHHRPARGAPAAATAAAAAPMAPHAAPMAPHAAPSWRRRGASHTGATSGGTARTSGRPRASWKTQRRVGVVVGECMYVRTLALDLWLRARGQTGVWALVACARPSARLAGASAWRLRLVVISITSARRDRQVALSLVSLRWCGWPAVRAAASHTRARGVAWRGVAWRGAAWRGVARRGVAWRGVAWRRTASRGVAWRGRPACPCRSRPPVAAARCRMALAGRTRLRLAARLAPLCQGGAP